MEAFTNKKIELKVQERRDAGEAGFTLIESICAIAIITIGLLGTAAAVSSALKFTRISRNVTEAKSIALAQVEQVHSLRDSRRLNFRQIENVGFVNNAGGKVPFDGFDTQFIGVADDPGADGIYGTPDDPAAPPAMTGFTRETVITDPLPNLKLITVTVRYPGADGQTYSLQCTSYINNDLKQE